MFIFYVFDVINIEQTADISISLMIILDETIELIVDMHILICDIFQKKTPYL